MHQRIIGLNSYRILQACRKAARPFQAIETVMEKLPGITMRFDQQIASLEALGDTRHVTFAPTENAQLSLRRHSSEFVSPEQTMGANNAPEQQDASQTRRPSRTRANRALPAAAGSSLLAPSSTATAIGPTASTSGSSVNLGQPITTVPERRPSRTRTQSATNIAVPDSTTPAEATRRPSQTTVPPAISYAAPDAVAPNAITRRPSQANVATNQAPQIAVINETYPVAASSTQPIQQPIVPLPLNYQAPLAPSQVNPQQPSAPQSGNQMANIPATGPINHNQTTALSAAQPRANLIRPANTARPLIKDIKYYYATEAVRRVGNSINFCAKDEIFQMLSYGEDYCRVLALSDGITIELPTYVLAPIN